MTIWDCRTHVRMTSMTSSVERTDLDFKISVALITKGHIYKLYGLIVHQYTRYTKVITDHKIILTTEIKFNDMVKQKKFLINLQGYQL